MLIKKIIGFLLAFQFVICYVLSEEIQNYLDDIKYGTSEVRYEAIEKLGEVEDEEEKMKVIPLLVEIVQKDDDVEARQRAIISLGQLGDPKVVGILSDALKDKNLRPYAIQSLGMIGDEEAVAPLIYILTKDSSSENRCMAAEALGEVGSKKATSSLVQGLSDTNLYVRAAAAKALGKIKDKTAVPSLLATLKDEEAEVRAASAYALGNIQEKEGIYNLVLCLKDENKKVQIAGSFALYKITGDNSQIGFIESMLQDPDPEIRIFSLETLSEIASPDSIPKILEVSKQDEDDSVQQWAKYALQVIKEKIEERKAAEKEAKEKVAEKKKVKEEAEEEIQREISSVKKKTKSSAISKKKQTKKVPQKKF